MSFINIKGQEQPIRILQDYLKQGRLQGGLLFAGPEGVGKKLAAKTLAKAANCLNEDLDSCDRCPSCLKIENNQHPDVHVIQLEDSDIKIEYIRQLQREICLKPYEGRKKVFIIDNVHRLTAEASGALLKTLEEPPKNSLIILVSDKPALLFKTIISRCKTVKFLPLARIKLQEIFKQDYGLENPVAHFLAYFSEGRFGRALKYKETDIIKEKNAVIDGFIFSPQAGFEGLTQEKDKIRGYLNILAAWFRDVYLIKIGMPHSEIINLDRKEDLLKLMSRFSFSALNEIMASLSDALFYLEHNINVKLLLYHLRSQLWKGQSA